MKIFLIILMTLSICTFQRCSHTSVAGGSTEADNPSIVARIVDQNLNPVANARVTIRTSKYLSRTNAENTIPDVLTSSDGSFKIEDVTPGQYHIEVNDGSSHAALFRCTMDDSDVVVDCGVAIIKPYGSVTGKVSTDYKSGTVFAYGMERNAVVEKTGEFKFKTLPEFQKYAFVFVPDESPDSTQEIDSISVTAGSETAVLFESWLSSAHIYINTSETGAHITENVPNFALLVSLNVTNFNFAEALPYGQDIRFVDSSGVALPYEIEFWDASQNRAAIWVRVPLVKAMRYAQFVIMKWGNKSATDRSNGASVFDTSDGYCAVWHLSENGNDLSSGYRDATNYKNNGTGFGFTNQSSVTGVAARAQNFNGVDNYIRVPDSPGLNLGTGDFSISTWVNFNALNVDQQQIISKYTGPQYNESGYELQLTDSSFVSHIIMESGRLDWGRSNRRVEANNWYYLTFSRNNGTVTWYQNGTVDSVLTSAQNINLNNPNELRLGRDAFNTGLEYFNGILDETRISSVSHSKAWVKLCYETQKPGQTAVTLQR